ncbi:hypothetical protein [Nocardia sp. NPDC057455]|uniref:hypothetical protein n=1 Tax=Nocardia sp. NPDC057455 TaxID=3346138 RepID=UPI00366D20E7
MERTRCLAAEVSAPEDIERLRPADTAQVRPCGWAAVDDVVPSITRLAGPGGPWMTSGIIVVDGGRAE